jgi:hypothetical protein
MAADPSPTPSTEAQLKGAKTVIAKWAAKPIVIAAVKAQNAKGPIAGMDNAKWAALKAGDPTVKALQSNKVAQWLTKKMKPSKGHFTEMFLNGSKGEKVAFVEKPTSYLHAGMPKFDVPMNGKIWQGKPEVDASSGKYGVQVAVPVLDAGKPIGVLVVGIAVPKPAAK